MADDVIDVPKKKSKLPLIIAIILILLLLGAGGGAVWYFFLAPKADAPEGQKAVKVEQKQGGEDAPTGFVVDLPTFLVNLSDPLGKRFIKVSMTLEMSSESAIHEVNSSMPRIRDAMIMLLSSKTYAELSPVEGKIVLKNEILARLNQILGGPKVKRISFTDFIIQ